MRENKTCLKIAGVLFLLFAASGCAKNVDKIEFNKWGNSFVPNQRNTTGMDLTAQGGAAQNGVIPQEPGKPGDPVTQNGIKMPKASLGGTYKRTFASSPNYRMVGGFHVTAGQ